MVFVFKTQPFHHQLEALERSAKADVFALFMEMGTGKTKVTIDTMVDKYLNGGVVRFVVWAPKGVYRNWVKELEIHLPDEIPVRIGVWQGLGTKKARKEMEYLMEPVSGTEPMRILLINIESISSKKPSKAYDLVTHFLNGASPTQCFMAIDESTSIAGHNSNRTKHVIKLGNLCQHKRILTGSPGDTPLKLYSQISFLSQKILGYTSFFPFRAKYCVLQRKDFGGRSFQVPVAFQNLDDLKAKIDPHSFRVTKYDCLDLPEKVYMKRSVELHPEQVRMYKQMKANAEAAIVPEIPCTDCSGRGCDMCGYTGFTSGVYMSAQEAIVQLLRLHQLVCGVATDEDGVVHSVPSNRMSALHSTIGEMKGKIIIWATYTQNIRDIQDSLEKEYGAGSSVSYYGATSSEDRLAAVEAFQNGDARFFISNKTGAYGLTLTAASNVIYYSNNYALEVRSQSEDRCHRIGQTKSVTYVDLVAEGTIDEKIIQALKNKINISAQLTGDAIRDWLV